MGCITGADAKESPLRRCSADKKHSECVREGREEFIKNLELKVVLIGSSKVGKT